MAAKGKPATIKDVRYALEFGGERLLRTYSHDERLKGGAEYSLSKTGIMVRTDVAAEVVADPHVVAVNDGLLPGHTQQWEWRE